MITFEERYRAEMNQRRERPFTTLPVYRFQSSCPVCKEDIWIDWGHAGSEACRKALPIERVIRSYPRGYHA